MRALSSVRSQQELGEIVTLKDSAHNKKPKTLHKIESIDFLRLFHRLLKMIFLAVAIRCSDLR